MRILGQGVTAKEVPYRHVGYLATTTVVGANWTLLGLGGALLLAGIAMTVSPVFRGLHARLTRGAAGHGRRWMRLGIGCAMVFAGAFIAVLSLEIGPTHPGAMTHVYSLQVLREIGIRRANGDPLPADIAGYRGVTRTTDAWKNEMRLVSQPGDNGTVFSVVSAGADGVFDSSDDLVLSEEPLRPKKGVMSPE